MNQQEQLLRELYAALDALLECCAADDPFAAVEVMRQAEAVLAKARGSISDVPGDGQ